jgi:hybrid cluster-associated redox disulfide protein
MRVVQGLAGRTFPQQPAVSLRRRKEFYPHRIYRAGINGSLPMHRIDFDDMPVSDNMRRWPVTIAVFIDLELNCVGCPIGPFHTLADAADEHGVALAELSATINDAIARSSARAEDPVRVRRR